MNGWFWNNNTLNLPPLFTGSHHHSIPSQRKPPEVLAPLPPPDSQAAKDRLRHLHHQPGRTCAGILSATTRSSSNVEPMYIKNIKRKQHALYILICNEIHQSATRAVVLVNVLDQRRSKVNVNSTFCSSFACEFGLSGTPLEEFWFRDNVSLD